MDTRTGVFICSCGDNIGGRVNTESLAAAASKMPGVVAAHCNNLLCSEDGRVFVSEKIAADKLDRVVVAACSPRDHEHTFRNACAAAGLNPFCMQMTNIREMCSWITSDETAALDKATRLVQAAVARVNFHEPLSPPDVECNTDVLVIGAGVAGISAAIGLADGNRKITVVEKSPCIGGMTTRFEDVYPEMECATCMLEPHMDEILHSEEIEVLTLSEISSVAGFIGNFEVKIKTQPRYIEPEACFGCNACLEPCPVETNDEFNENLSKRKAIYMAYPGALPNVPVVDPALCLRFNGEECTKCADACGFGAFDFDQAPQEIERKFGSVIIATGFELPGADSLGALGYGKMPDVVTALEMERMISTTGPYEGKVLKRDGAAPEKIVFVHCAGRGTAVEKDYCSGVCCMDAVKLSRLIHKGNPDMALEHIHADLCAPGQMASGFIEEAREQGIIFSRMGDYKTVEVENGGGIVVKYETPDGRDLESTADMVVLMTPLVPAAGTAQLCDMFGIEQDRFGFVKSVHGLLEPVTTNYGGVFVAGCASGPLDIRSSVSSARAASGEVLAKLVPGKKLEVEAITTYIDEDMCSGCRMCNTMCPYRAITFDEEAGVSRVNELLCRGCGTCAAACPSGAAVSRHFNRKQINAEIEGVLK